MTISLSSSRLDSDEMIPDGLHPDLVRMVTRYKASIDALEANPRTPKTYMKEIFENLVPGRGYVSCNVLTPRKRRHAASTDSP